MGRLANEEKKKREIMSEYIIEALLGHERSRELTQKNIDAFVELASVFTESGMSSDELFSLLKRIEKELGYAM